MLKSAVISDLLPKAEFKETVIKGISTIEWFDERQQPTDAELEAHWEVMKSRNAVYTKRLSEYPSIGDQLDALFHAGVFPAEMAAQIQAVKDKYPKGGSV